MVKREYFFGSTSIIPKSVEVHDSITSKSFGLDGRGQVDITCKNGQRHGPARDVVHSFTMTLIISDYLVLLTIER